MADIRRIIKVALYTPGMRGKWGLPVYFHGPPGVAKTHYIEDSGYMLGMPHVETLSPGERGEGAFGVVPVPDKTENGDLRLSYPPPEWYFEMDEGGLVFVDEINRAYAALQAPLLGLVNDRRIGGRYLGPHVRVLGALNPADTAAGVHDLDSALANRGGHMPWPMPEVDAWCGYMLAGATNDGTGEKPLKMADEEARVMKQWPSHWARAVGLTTAFVRSRRDLMHKQPKSNDPQGSGAWPSYRTWELATRALAGAELHGCTDAEQEELVAAFVGLGAGSEFFAFTSKQDLPDAEDVLDGKVSFKHDPSRLDRTSAVLSSCAALVAPATCEKRTARAGALWKIMGDVAKDAADVAVPAAQVLVRSKLSGKTIPESTPVLIRLQPVLAAAGITG